MEQNLTHPLLSAQKPTETSDFIDLFTGKKDGHMSKYQYNDEKKDWYAILTKFNHYYLTNSEVDLIAALHMQTSEFNISGMALVEIGPGDQDVITKKTLPFIKHLKPSKYIALDFAAQYARSAASLVASNSNIESSFMVCDAFAELPTELKNEPKCIAILGSTFGNLTEEQLLVFTKTLMNVLGENDFLAVTLDTNDDSKMLDYAYNNLICEQIMLNIMRYLKTLLPNQEFDPEAFKLRYNFNREKSCVKLSLMPTKPQKFKLLDTEISITENDAFKLFLSHKLPGFKAGQFFAKLGLKIAHVLERPGNPMKIFVLQRAS